MRIRGTDDFGDWKFGKGKQSYDVGSMAIMTNIKTRLLSFLNDCFYDMDAGIDWWNLLGGKNKKALLLTVDNTILSSYGVQKLISSSLTIDQNRAAHITYQIKILDETLEDEIVLGGMNG